MQVNVSSGKKGMCYLRRERRLSLHWGGVLTERALSKFPDEPAEVTDRGESQTFLNRILWQNMENRESISCFTHVLSCANIG